MEMIFNIRMAMVLKNYASSGIKQGMDLCRRALHKRDIYIKRERERDVGIIWL